MCAVGRDQRPVEETVENFLSGTALEGLGKPDQFAIGVDGGVVKDLLLRCAQLRCGWRSHVDLLFTF